MRLIFVLCPILLFAGVSENSKVLICGVCRDVEPAFLYSMKSIEKLGSRFKDYRVILYENNSVDQTVHLLHYWATKNSKVSYRSEMCFHEDLVRESKSLTCQGNPCRMEMIAKARNYVINRVLDEQYESFDYVIIADLDFKSTWDIEGIVQSLEYEGEWDAIFANGISGDGTYYDRYAYRDSNDPLGPELIQDEFWDHVSERPIKFHPTENFVRVYSAFGGLGIYKRESIKGCSYSGTVTEDYNKYMSAIVQKHWDDPALAHYKKLNTDLTYEDPIRWKPNSGYTTDFVCCEHLPFHASMALKGHGNFFINPKLTVKY